MTTIEHRHLRSALEFAVLIAAEGQKRRPPLSFPKELKPFIGKSRVATNSLGRIRRAVEADPSYRSALSLGADPDLVDDVGRLWLAGRQGWEAEAAQIIADRDEAAERTDLRRDLKRAQKRRVAAEHAAARVQVDVMQRDATIADQATQLDDLRAELAKAIEALDEARAELVDTRNEARHARDREAAAVARAELSAQQPVHPPPSVVDPAQVESPSDEALLRSERQLAEVVEASRVFAERIESLATSHRPEPATRSPSIRQALPIPGGLISTSAAAARHLLGQRVPVLVDGYNVAKLAWPDRSLEQQRDVLVARCENLARRYSAQLTVVFDGDSVPGAHATGRRTIRVVYSPAGTTADDVIRAEVDHVPDDTGVIVITNDREIIADVRAVGANVVPSNAFVAVL